MCEYAFPANSSDKGAGQHDISLPYLTAHQHFFGRFLLIIVLHFLDAIFD